LGFTHHAARQGEFTKWTKHRSGLRDRVSLVVGTWAGKVSMRVEGGKSSCKCKQHPTRGRSNPSVQQSAKQPVGKP
jgi:hypothetical protein